MVLLLRINQCFQIIKYIIRKVHIINKEQLQIFDSPIPNEPASIMSGSLSYSSLGCVMYNLDFKTGEYIFMSPSVKLLTGYSKDELNEIGLVNSPFTFICR